MKGLWIAGQLRGEYKMWALRSVQCTRGITVTGFISLNPALDVTDYRLSRPSHNQKCHMRTSSA